MYIIHELETVSSLYNVHSNQNQNINKVYYVTSSHQSVISNISNIFNYRQGIVQTDKVKPGACDLQYLYLGGIKFL